MRRGVRSATWEDFVGKPRWPDDTKQAIYFLGARDASAVKIGCTVSRTLKTRIYTLQIGCPFRLTLLAVCPVNGAGGGWRYVEADFHAKWQHLRMTGEWFRAEPGLLGEALALRRRAEVAATAAAAALGPADGPPISVTLELPRRSATDLRCVASAWNMSEADVVGQLARAAFKRL